MAGEKRRKVANNLWVGEDPRCKVATPHTIGGVIESAQVVLAGSCDGRSLNSYEYVQVPYDIVIKYFCRAESLCLRMNAGSRPHRLEQLDLAERSERAHRLANSPDALGAIIAQVFRDRYSHWVPPPR